MSLAELTHGLGESVATLTQEERGWFECYVMTNI